jgi:HlyD family secretion protein
MIGVNKGESDPDTSQRGVHRKTIKRFEKIMASKSPKTMQLRWSRILPVFLAGLLVLLGGQWFRSTQAQAPAPKAKTSSIPTEKSPATASPGAYTVAKGDVSRTIIITGELQASSSREILVPVTKASSTSTITFLAPEGKVIRKGEPLVEFDPSSLLSQMAEQQRSVEEGGLNIEKKIKDLEAQRAGLLNTVAQAEGSLKIAKLNADIPMDLQPANTFLKYQTDYEKAKLSLDKAKEQLANFEASYDSQLTLVKIQRSQAELTLKRMQGDLELLSIKAPQDGVVIYGDNWQSNRRYQVGDVAFPNMPVVILPDLSAMQVTGFVYDTELQFLAIGMPCEIHLDAVPGKSWRGKVQSLTSVATRKGFATTQKVFKAVIRLDSVDLESMKPGMTARAEFLLSMASGVTIVPRQNLGLDVQGRYYVLKETGAKTPPALEYVKPGVFGDLVVQILSGIEAGDRILSAQKTSETK